jgi:uncharacterized protein YkwD
MPTAGSAAVSVSASAPGSATAAASGPSVTAGWQARMLARVNSVRTAAGLAPLALCRTLDRSAQAYAARMAADDRFDHVATDGTGPGERLTAAGYRWSAWGENIAAGQHTVYEAMQGWRKSPTHLATMTNPRYTHVGFGHAVAAGSRYVSYWVQDYGNGSC